ncbi:hypothetical protein [Natronospira bacteriovora]|uniref:Outer membrane beta-barrel porin/alpha-amylase n=1 Tax=Natronospira bacteriovora TaxID=3069753 RepID=A0ABU0WA62_9GAMM|nr:hypothetical protein [Natronospira sp. AB-CW4]MDQ2070808.1 hypothetical protein [Natronospira sp. AB-CW4]
MLRCIRAACPLLLAALPLDVTAMSWFGDVSVQLSHDDNLNRAAQAQDERSDTLLDAELAWLRPFDLREWGTLDATVAIGARLHDRFDDLNESRLVVSGHYHRRLGLGPQAPWIAAHLDYGYHGVKDEWREGTRQSIGASTGRGVGEHWQLRVGLAYDRQSPDNVRRDEGNAPYNVFRLSTLGLQTDLDYRMDNGWLWLSGLAYQRGDFNASTTDPDLFDDEQLPWLDDPVFGESFRTYRIDGQAWSVQAGVSIPLGDRASINLIGRFTDVTTDNDISYGATRWQLSFMQEL